MPKDNKAQRTVDRTPEGDKQYTPFYAVEPILKYLRPKSKILCPFDERWSAFVVRLAEEGHEVVCSDLATGKDFFTYTLDEVKEFHYIISNPPFSLKDEVLKHLYKLQRPFMMLLPLGTLQGVARVKLIIENGGLEVLTFHARIEYHSESMEKVKKGISFGSAYFCKDILPQKLIFEEIDRTVNRSLKSQEVSHETKNEGNE